MDHTWDKNTHFLTYARTVHGDYYFNSVKEILKTNLLIARHDIELKFLFKCKNYDLVPQNFVKLIGMQKFLHSHTSHTHLKHRSEKQQLQTLNNTICKYLSNVHNLKKVFSSILHILKTKFPSNITISLEKLLDLQKSKLKRLWIPKINNIFNTHLQQITTPKTNIEHWFINLSNITIPSYVREIGSLGPKFCLKTTLNSKTVINIIKNLEETLYFTHYNQIILNQIRNESINVLHKHDYKNKPHISFRERSLQHKVLLTKKFLSTHKLLLTISDKGNNTVCLRTDDYIMKAERLLSDTDTYKLLKSNPIHTLRNLSKNIYNDWNTKKYFPRKLTKFDLSFTNCTLSRFYALPKTHKPNWPLRPIISSITDPTYYLAKCLSDHLSNILPTPKSNLRNSTELLLKLKHITTPVDYILISLDAVSLFTNIPLNLVIDSLDAKKTLIKRKSKIPLKTLTDTITFLYYNTYFQFNKKFYKQIEGCPMGSPISPILANIAMEHLELRALKALRKLNIIPLFYHRYVDDIIMCIHKDHITTVLEQFNLLHNKVQFTLELEKNGAISFLDVLIMRQTDGTLLTNWYQKPISTGRTINFNSNQPLHQKKAIIYNLVDRALLLSDPHFHAVNLQKIQNILLNNDYPITFINRYIKRRQHMISQQTISQHPSNTPLRTTKPSTQTGKIDRQSNRRLTVTIPFISKHLYCNLKKTLSHWNIHSVPKSHNKLSKIIIRGKDKLSKLETCNTVYRLNCDSCNATYVGETKRELFQRIKEHKNKTKSAIQNLNNSQSNIPPGPVKTVLKTDNGDPDSDPAKLAVVTEHMLNHPSHNFVWSNPTVLDTEEQYHKRLLSEKLNIAIQENPINKQEDTQYLHKPYIPLILKFSNT